MHLDDVDLPGRRITIAGHDRPLDELTHHALLDWLDYRHRRWPNTANPHLLVSTESALRHAPVSHTWILNMRGLAATLSNGCAQTASLRRPSPPAATRCTWPRSSVSARTRPFGTPPTPGSSCRPHPGRRTEQPVRAEQPSRHGWTTVRR